MDSKFEVSSCSLLDYPQVCSLSAHPLVPGLQGPILSCRLCLRPDEGSPLRLPRAPSLGSRPGVVAGRLCGPCYLGGPEIPLISSSCASAGLTSSGLAQEEGGGFVVSLFHSNGLDDDSLNFSFLSI